MITCANLSNLSIALLLAVQENLSSYYFSTILLFFSEAKTRLESCKCKRRLNQSFGKCFSCGKFLLVPSEKKIKVCMKRARKIVVGKCERVVKSLQNERKTFCVLASSRHTWQPLLSEQERNSCYVYVARSVPIRDVQSKLKIGQRHIVCI